jgi:catechol 2,3-dioxygenase
MPNLTQQPRAGYFRPRRLGHINIYIGEYERSVRFYREIAGLGDGWTRPAIGGGFFNNGFTHHDIGFIPWSSPITRKSVPGPGLNHLGFELESEAELVSDFQAARADGITFHATVDHLLARSVYSWDPDGFGIELYADTEISYNQPDFLQLRRASGEWLPGNTPPSPVRHYVTDPRPRIYANALFHAKKVTGAVFVTEAFEATHDYYTKLVGLTAVAGSRDGAFCTLAGSCGGRDVTLVRAAAGLQTGFHHMQFEVFGEADLRSSLERVAQFGIVVERQIDHASRAGVVVRDPDGLRVLFYSDRAPVSAGDLQSFSEGNALWLV